MCIVVKVRRDYCSREIFGVSSLRHKEKSPPPDEGKAGKHQGLDTAVCGRIFHRGFIRQKSVAKDAIYNGSITIDHFR